MNTQTRSLTAEELILEQALYGIAEDEEGNLTLLGHQKLSKNGLIDIVKTSLASYKKLAEPKAVEKFIEEARMDPRCFDLSSRVWEKLNWTFNTLYPQDDR